MLTDKKKLLKLRNSYCILPKILKTMKTLKKIILCSITTVGNNDKNTIQPYKNNSMSLFYEYSCHSWHESRRFFVPRNAT